MKFLTSLNWFSQALRNDSRLILQTGLNKIKKFHPFTWVVIVFIGLSFVAASVSSVRATNDQLKQREIRVLRLSQTITELKRVNASKDLTIQQKASKEAELQKSIDDLNKQLQTRRAAQVAPVAVAPQPAPVSGLGGSFSGFGFSNPYAFGNCTYWVATHIHVPDNLGNANTWAYWAQRDGYSVGSVPRAGSVAQTSAGPYGHVAIVMAVSGGQTEVSEMNVRGFNLVDEAWYATSYFRYIYF